MHHLLACFRLFILLICFTAPLARAVVVQFDLQGTAGPGLLPGNQNPATTGGTGGELGTGISFDNVSKMLTVNVGWGSTNGFTDLSSTPTAAHIHGPTVSTAPGSYTENAGVLFPLTINSGTAQGNTITALLGPLSAAQEGYLTNGQLYLNVHTAINGGGEIRGNLVLSPTVLAVDFNDRSSDPATNTMNGFHSFLIASNISATAIQTGALIRTFGTYTVTVSGSGANPGYDDRQRTTPVNGGGLTSAQIYRDFIFSPDSGTGGLNVTVDGLTPNQAYRVTGWTFDQGTTGGRLSDWSANGTLMVDNYSFNGATLPTSDTQYQWTFKVSATASGQIALTGRRDSSSPAGIAVFLNALKIETATPDAPFIVTGPQPLEVYAGDNPAFTASVGGTAPFTYQWLKDSNSIPRATNLTFAITNSTPGDAGFYQLIASNPSGSATSAPAALVVQTVTGYSSGLLAYWPLNLLGPDAYDISGNNQTLYATNLDNGNVVPGQRGNGISFNGQDEFLTRTNGPGDALPAYSYPAYTVAMWVKGWYTNQLDRRVWCESANTNNNTLMTLGTDAAGTNGNVDIFIRNNNATTPHNHRKSTTTNAFDGQWHHIAWVDNNGAARLYVDGVLDATDFSYVRGVLTPNLATLGAVYRTTNIAHFNGALDDAAVWRRALSQAEIQHFMVYGESAFTDVTTTNDSGPGSLRTALTAAYPGDTINFASLLATQTISLASEIVVNVPAPGVTVEGLYGSDRITIDDGTNTNHRLFNVTGGTVTFRRLTLANGGGASFADVGGAIRNAGNLQLEECVLQGNHSATEGGAIYQAAGTLSLTSCTLSNNFAAGNGGAIKKDTGNMNLLRSTLFQNTSSAQGGAIQGAGMTLEQCTLTDNFSLVGGAIMGSSITLLHCTIFGNTRGGGVASDSLSMSYSILAGNSPNNLFGTFIGTNNLTSGDPLLAPLGDYGGSTLTMALMPGSPARNAATNSTESADQRGFFRDGTPDIGAYEAGASGRTITYNQFIWESLPTADVPSHAEAFDYDGDGHSNYDEWWMNTDPADAASGLRILSIVLDNGTNFLISFPTAPPPRGYGALRYTLEYSDVLPAVWTNDVTDTINGNGLVETFTNTPAPGTNRFYRVWVGRGATR